MPKPNLGEVQTIPDPMLSDNFELQIPNPPVGDGRSLRLQCKTAAKPGSTLEQVLVQLFGHEMEFSGRLTFSHTMSVTYVESNTGLITKQLEAWQQISRTTQTQHGHFKKAYARDATFLIYDQEGSTKLTYNIVNIWPSEVPEISFDGSAANAIEVNVIFTYDYYEIKGGGR